MKKILIALALFAVIGVIVDDERRERGNTSEASQVSADIEVGESEPAPVCTTDECRFEEHYDAARSACRDYIMRRIDARSTNGMFRPFFSRYRILPNGTRWKSLTPMASGGQETIPVSG